APDVTFRRAAGPPFPKFRVTDHESASIVSGSRDAAAVRPLGGCVLPPKGARQIMAFTPSTRRQAVGLLLCSALFAWTALAGASANAARAGGDKKNGKGDLESFQGGWSVTSINKDNQEIPEEFVKDLKVSFTGNKLTMSIMGKDITGT